MKFSTWMPNDRHRRANPSADPRRNPFARETARTVQQAITHNFLHHDATSRLRNDSVRNASKLIPIIFACSSNLSQPKSEGKEEESKFPWNFAYVQHISMMEASKKFGAR